MNTYKSKKGEATQRPWQDPRCAKGDTHPQRVVVRAYRHQQRTRRVTNPRVTKGN